MSSNDRLIRILHVSDAHCNTMEIAEVLKRESYDSIIYTGDFECLDVVDFLLEQGGLLYSTTGEYDNPAIYRSLKNSGVLVDGVIADLKEYLIAGVGGLEPINNLKSLLSKFTSINYKIDILASHHPPVGVFNSNTNARYRGLVELWEVITRINPLIHVFGHIHENPGVVKLRNTYYVNSGSIALGFYTIITMRGNVVENIEVKKL